jgi:hypothetical protein
MSKSIASLIADGLIEQIMHLEDKARECLVDDQDDPIGADQRYENALRVIACMSAAAVLVKTADTLILPAIADAKEQKSRVRAMYRVCIKQMAKRLVTHFT